ncbi:uncharacterized protein METZ01_LOCUS42453 [marine metagenome]|uniref:Uncharacterized protein n=1 Tax=marine metagenome TaxID=408172 RepID=A0A381RFE5_9ZZZZ
MENQDPPPAMESGLPFNLKLLYLKSKTL